MNHHIDPADPDTWPHEASACRAMQDELARQVVLRPPDPASIRVIAGVDIGFGDGGRITRAAAVVFDANTMTPFDQVCVEQPTRMPYIPGLLSFRETPAAMAALDKLATRPDLVFVDGHGIAHPRRIGVASHLGVVTGLATIGIAKKRLCGHHQTTPATPGECDTLYDRDAAIGVILKSRPRANPIYVSPGHRMDIAGALAWTRAALAGYRLPEPTRLADRLASARDL